jgi:hypothetical protein
LAWLSGEFFIEKMGFLLFFDGVANRPNSFLIFLYQTWNLQFSGMVLDSVN